MVCFTKNGIFLSKSIHWGRRFFYLQRGVLTIRGVWLEAE